MIGQRKQSAYSCLWQGFYSIFLMVTIIYLHNVTNYCDVTEHNSCQFFVNVLSPPFFLGRWVRLHLGYLNSSCIKKKVVLYCFWVPREINLRFFGKTQWHTFLLVSSRHVGSPSGWAPTCVSIQSAVNLGNTLLRIAWDLIPGEVVYIAIIYHIPDSWINLLNYYVNSFDHMTDENRE